MRSEANASVVIRNSFDSFHFDALRQTWIPIEKFFGRHYKVWCWPANFPDEVQQWRRQYATDLLLHCGMLVVRPVC